MNELDKKAIELLASIVKIPSISGHEINASNALVASLPDFGWEKAYVDEIGNVVAHKGHGEKELILLGHIDTVPGGPPFSISEEYLMGRGAVDAKGPLCAMAVAGGSCSLPEGWTITLIGAAGEEEDSRGAKFRLNLHSPQGCIIGEPTGTIGIATSYRGRILTKVHSRDEGAHRSWSSGPMTKVLLAVAKIIETLSPQTQDQDREFIANISSSVTYMKGEESQGRVAEVLLDVRIPSCNLLDDITRKIESICSHFGVDFSFADMAKPHQVDKNDPMVIALRRAIRINGHKPRLLAKSGTSDFNTVAPWGCPMAVYGPGDSLLEHTEEEKINLKEYVTAIKILKDGIHSFFEMK